VVLLLHMLLVLSPLAVLVVQYWVHKQLDVD
jgi:hypothetical protein